MGLGAIDIFEVELTESANWWVIEIEEKKDAWKIKLRPSLDND